MAIQMTPSAKSAFIAGSALSLVAWLSLFKLDAIAQLFRVNRIVKQEKVFTWIDSNRSLSLLFTEFVNFGVHGVTNSSSVTFALGSTITNALFIYLVLPIVQAKKRSKFKTKIHAVPNRREQRTGRRVSTAA
jgi:hypothetical protein